MKKAMVILMRFRDIDDSLDVIEYSDSCIQEDVVFVKPGIWKIGRMKQVLCIEG